MQLIQLRNIHKTYTLGEVEVQALRNVSLDIDRGEYVALMGASGSGKTTPMNTLGCLDHPTSNSYLLENQEIAKHARRAVVIRDGQVICDSTEFPRTIEALHAQEG